MSPFAGRMNEFLILIISYVKADRNGGPAGRRSCSYIAHKTEQWERVFILPKQPDDFGSATTNDVNISVYNLAPNCTQHSPATPVLYLLSRLSSLYSYVLTLQNMVTSVDWCCSHNSLKVISELSSRQSKVLGQSRIWSLCSRRSASIPDSQAHREPPSGRSYILYTSDAFFLFQITCPDIDLILIRCKWGAWVFFS